LKKKKKKKKKKRNPKIWKKIHQTFKTKIFFKKKAASADNMFSNAEY
jgi:hypothetical protein